MKKIYSIYLALMITASALLPRQANAQAPERMSYQAVVRDGGNDLVASKAVGMQVSILQGSASGTIVYVETHTPTTNVNGLVSIQIGLGAVENGDFTAIDWENGPYFIRTEIDPAGETNYTITGTSQLLSVPYALHAKTAESVTGGGSSNDFYLGQDTLGGIVFYIYLDSDGQQHGLIVNPTETTSEWQTAATSTGADRTWDGAYNTEQMTGSPAKTYCQGLSTGGFNDWYLPSIDELSILWHNRFHINKGLDANGYPILPHSIYWSSTEYASSLAFKFTFNFGSTSSDSKTDPYSVRAIRAF